MLIFSDGRVRKPKKASSNTLVKKEELIQLEGKISAAGATYAKSITDACTQSRIRGQIYRETSSPFARRY